MDDQNEFGTDEARELAVNDPLAWVAQFIELNGYGTDVSEYGVGTRTKPLGGYVLIEVSSEGGYEGGGEHTEVTYAIAPEGGKAENGRVKDAAAYVEWSGTYYSYDGTTWDDEGYLVEPQDVVVVQYQMKK